MTLFFIALFLLAVIIHEVAHGWMANKLGDPTAKFAGRLTLNPIAHIDPMGTILFPLLLSLSGSPIVFGWAKPVPINFALLRNGKKGLLLVSAAGIGANAVLAVLFALLLRMGLFPYNSYGWVFLNYGIMVNLVLAVFNAIPIPPLDGSKIVLSILPKELANTYLKIEPYGFVILLGLAWLGLLGRVIWPVVTFASRLLGAGIL
ncbi:MAG: site-2 protease family protein [Candidatus Omnitrophota bacterium]